VELFNNALIDGVKIVGDDFMKWQHVQGLAVVAIGVTLFRVQII
jgi:hypothetical protein